MNEPMISDRRIREEGVRRFASPTEDAPPLQRASDPRAAMPLPLPRRIVSAFGSVPAL